MTTKTERNFAQISERLGFAPWGGCGECRMLSYCKANEHRLATLPCELDDQTAGVATVRRYRHSTWDVIVGAA